MKRIRRSIVLGMLLLIVTSPLAFANMKKGNVGGGGTKGFAFSTFSDGFCTISTIYDKTSSQLGVGLGLTSGDLVCVGLSSQSNFQSCTAGLPAGTYLFVVVSLAGASPFRVVVNCSDQQNAVNAGASSKEGITIREIELGEAGNKLLDQFQQIAKKSGRIQ